MTTYHHDRSIDATRYRGALAMAEQAETLGQRKTAQSYRDTAALIGSHCGLPACGPTGPRIRLPVKASTPMTNLPASPTVSDDEAERLCQVWGGQDACRYLSYDDRISSHVCDKHHSHWRIMIDADVREGRAPSTGNHCRGKR